MRVIEYDENSVPEISRMRLNEDLEKARETAMRILASSGRSKRDLHSRLEAKGHDPKICWELVERLEAVGLIDERETACMIARTRFAERGRSRRAIADELNRKGFDQDAIQAAIDQIDPDDEREAVLALARRRLAKDQSGDRAARIRRAVGHIARKGYSPQLAMACIREVLAQEESELD